MFVTIKVSMMVHAMTRFFAIALVCMWSCCNPMESRTITTMAARSAKRLALVFVMRNTPPPAIVDTSYTM